MSSGKSGIAAIRDLPHCYSWTRVRRFGHGGGEHSVRPALFQCEWKEKSSVPQIFSNIMSTLNGKMKSSANLINSFNEKMSTS
jgi:hypothetical protein